MRMRFPYFYQLMLGFLLVIVTLMAITSFSILHFGRSELLTELEDTFLHYAYLIEEAEHDESQLAAYDDILGNQEVEYGIYNREGVLEYPNIDHTFQANLSEDDMETLRSGESLLLRTDQQDARGNNRPSVNIYVPMITEENEYQGFIGVGRPMTHIEHSMDELTENVFKAFLLSTVIAIIMSLLFSYYLVKRVNRLSNATQRVAKGDYDIYLSHSNRDEIDRLSADFNKMVKALSEWRREVLHLENRRKTFMQDVAHEMRTPLTTINGLLEGLE
ncbi:MAG TPA: HAMP domain-containing protein, partial [Atopostipes sp.]|nr:HAMP domain-containing protein [Atopostipes sp.]